MEERKIFGIYRIVRQPTDPQSPVFWRDLSEDFELIAVAEDEATALDYSEQCNHEENPERWFYPRKRYDELKYAWFHIVQSVRTGTDSYGEVVENKVKETHPDFVMKHFQMQHYLVTGIGTTYTYIQDIKLIRK